MTPALTISLFASTTVLVVSWVFVRPRSEDFGGVVEAYRPYFLITAAGSGISFIVGVLLLGQRDLTEVGIVTASILVVAHNMLQSGFFPVVRLVLSGKLPRVSVPVFLTACALPVIGLFVQSTRLAAWDAAVAFGICSLHAVVDDALLFSCLFL